MCFRNYLHKSKMISIIHLVTWRFATWQKCFMNKTRQKKFCQRLFVWVVVLDSPLNSGSARVTRMLQHVRQLLLHTGKHILHVSHILHASDVHTHFCKKHFGAAKLRFITSQVARTFVPKWGQTSPVQVQLFWLSKILSKLIATYYLTTSACLNISL